MMTLLIVLATAAEAYLLGSIDTGILVSKYLYHDDVRNYGSGAAGMTNMLRTFGKKAAALTAFGDVLKGALAVCIGRWLFGYLPAGGAVSPYLGVYLAAILATIGHLKPLYFGFKGGKAGDLGDVVLQLAEDAGTQMDGKGVQHVGILVDLHGTDLHDLAPESLLHPVIIKGVGLVADVPFQIK